ncbi:MAG: FAD-binding oxidoreductase [Candidatus Geothermincolia bacterium]
MLSSKAFEELRDIVGEENITREPAILETYAYQFIAEVVCADKYMGVPCAVVLPANSEEVLEIVRACNRHKIQYKAISTGWGAYGASTEDGIVQIDLRRMNRILKIDAKNMYAVVEPYVVGATLQAEAFKLGLNTHIIGAGSNTSILASATSVMGCSIDGASMGYSNRNLLGFEWVTPQGELISVGSFDDTGEYFTGDGPGFSLRGLIRGYTGAFGGLGVFTKCAVKLYPWYGPSRLEISGTSPDYDVEVPENHAAYVLTFPGWSEIKDFGNSLGEAEVAMSLSHHNAAAMIAAGTESNKEFYELWRSGLLTHAKYTLEVVLMAQSAEEFAYQERVLRDLMKKTGGLMLISTRPDARYYLDLLRSVGRILRDAGVKKTASGMPDFLAFMRKNLRKGKSPNTFAKTLYLALVTQSMQAKGMARFAGSFWTSMGALTSWDCAVENVIEGEKIKRKWIDRGSLMDDGAECSGGGAYESGCYAHLEEIYVYDPSDADSARGGVEFILDTVRASIDKHLGFDINCTGDLMHALHSPHVYGYHEHLADIKEEFDPENLSDGSSYICREGVDGIIQTIEEGGQVDAAL